MQAFQFLNYLLFSLSLLTREVELKSQYVEPLSMGMKMSIPYDIGNIFNRPIAGVSSVVITVSFAIIILLGIVTSPFGYFFGVPSRKYVLGGNPDTMHRIGLTGTPRMAWDRTIMDFLENNQLPAYRPSFRNTFLRMFNESDLVEEDCSLLVMCYGHGVLNYLPNRVTQVYAVFSQSLNGIPATVQTAIIEGIRDNSKCEGLYRNCPDSVFSLIIKTLLNFLPDSVKNENFRKRKGAMYL